MSISTETKPVLESKNYTRNCSCWISLKYTVVQKGISERCEITFITRQWQNIEISHSEYATVLLFTHRHKTAARKMGQVS